MKLLKILKILLLITTLGCSPALFSKNIASPHYSQLSFDENLNLPSVSPKAGPAVGRHMESVKKWFDSKGLTTKMVRNNQVVLVTVPAETLFEPNQTSLKEGANDIFNYFTQGITHPENYRIIVAVYTDDTGDNQYSEALTKDRAQSIKSRLDKIAHNHNIEPNISYYSFGKQKEIVPNNSIVNRSKNRRIEFYLVPETKTIESSRSSNAH